MKKLLEFISILYIISLSSVVYAGQLCDKEIYDAEFHIRGRNETVKKIEVLAIWSPMRTGWHKVNQLCSNYTGLPLERKCYRSNETKTATWDTDVRGIELLECDFIPNSCVSESFVHVYLKKNKVHQRHVNTWPSAKLGEYAKTKDVCLLDTGLPLTRKCVYNSKNYTVNWEQGEKYKNIQCLLALEQKIVTLNLTNLYKEVEADNKTNQEAVKQLTDILSQPDTVRIATDLEISTNILETITATDKSPELMPKVVEVTNLIMHSNENAVNSSKQIETPTNLLKTVETYLDDMADVIMPTYKCSEIPSGVNKIEEDLTSVFFINPHCSNISGIAVYSMKNPQETSILYDTATKTYFRYIHLNQTLEEILNEPHLEVASFIPQDVWQTLQKEASESVTAIRFSLYRNGNFFVNNKDNEITPASVIMKMSLPGYTDDLPGSVPLIFGNNHEISNEKPQCGTYDYKEKWKMTGASEFYTKYAAVCKITRLTPFGALVGINYKYDYDADETVLTIAMGHSQEIISIVGCVLSLFGLFCIWLTAICFKKWRSQSSNMLLLNICLVLTLIMAYFMIINVPDLRDMLIDATEIMHCYAEGAILQYLVLVLFLWMLIIAILQYRRYVTVFGTERSPCEVAMYIAGAWLSPIIPTAVVVLYDPDSYLPISENGDVIGTFCYPSGRSFYFGIFLPLCVVIVVNVWIFLYILCSLRRSQKKFKCSRDQKDFTRQVHLGILLFFLLGITWLFGICAHIFKSHLLSFAFSLTSTLQGFVLFIYFVVFDKSARRSWTQCCVGKDYYTMENISSTPLTYSSLRNSRKSI
uniref:G-protein coupled receptors family 2 profile 2 domain-containing protein n=1 Tax=Stomoxys calcitrans TaxID=35570 RepID=A0A1I8Q4J1_STOCA